MIGDGDSLDIFPRMNAFKASTNRRATSTFSSDIAHAVSRSAHHQRGPNIAVTGNGSGADVTGLATAVSVNHADLTLDTLTVDTKLGTDNVSQAGVIGLVLTVIN